MGVGRQRHTHGGCFIVASPDFLLFHTHLIFSRSETWGFSVSIALIVGGDGVHGIACSNRMHGSNAQGFIDADAGDSGVAPWRSRGLRAADRGHPRIESRCGVSAFQRDPEARHSSLLRGVVSEPPPPSLALSISHSLSPSFTLSLFLSPLHPGFYGTRCNKTGESFSGAHWHARQPPDTGP